MNDQRWINVNLLGELKSRCSFTSTFDKENGKIYIFGGISSSDAILNDFVSLKLNMKFNEVEEEELKTSKDSLDEEQFFTGLSMQDYFIQ